MMYSVGLTTTIIIVIVVVIVAVITTLAVTVLIIICIKIKTSLKPDHKTLDTQSNAAYGCVGGGKTSSVPAEYETPITTAVDVQSNVAYGHISGGKPTAIYETVSTDL